jgi:hypothetical protein
VLNDTRGGDHDESVSCCFLVSGLSRRRGARAGAVSVELGGIIRHKQDSSMLKLLVGVGADITGRSLQ